MLADQLEISLEISLEIYIELGKSRSVACAWEWPGWCRYGKTAESALQTLLDYAPRYQLIARRAGQEAEFAADVQATVVSTQLQGNANTDWAPSLITTRDSEPRNATEAEREVKLCVAAWSSLNEVAATSTPTLRKGPRGGGRDRDEVMRHVVEAERAYARKLGVNQATLAHHEFHDQISATLRAASDGSPLVPGGWPASYAVRRMAWHVVDHLWEIGDRQT